MISDLAVYAERLTQGLIQAKNSSIICIKTTHEVFLIFDEDDTKPACAISFGNKERMQHLYYVLKLLNKALPQNTPHILAFSEIANGRYILIQSGVAGTPWFQISRRINKSSDWLIIFTRSLKALRQLQSTVRSIPEWNKKISLGDELLRVLTACQHLGFSDITIEQVMSYSQSLKEIGEINCFNQHGDFCLNNLIFTDQSVNIIDYDEFGLTSMPYHDEFLLAHSIIDVSKGKTGSYPGDLLEYFLDREYYDGLNSPEILQGLYIYHLLYRLLQADSLEQRKYLKPMLIDTINNFLEQPDRYLPPYKLG